MSDEKQNDYGDWDLLRWEEVCHWGKRMYVGTVSGFDVWKVSLLSEEGVKTEISAIVKAPDCVLVVSTLVYVI